eukprot:TRINITY_DN4978_c0_g1_i5.p1 TRINITY_DN4978_c0_g1~~TRINITY_DN4978_c0_g1_i5.p1  ORF type:complete len:484 (-),score=86.78 TRINITY_DN4978_c0_g1_i5:505-1956(-)
MWTTTNCVGAPSARQGHAATCIESSHRLLVFGGYTADGPVGDTYEYDLGTATWFQVQCKHAPAARHNASAVSIGDCVYLFGGALGKVGCANDLWCYRKATWRRVNSKGAPSPRWGHSAVVYQHSMFIFGGLGDDGYHNDLHRFSFKKQQWTQVQPRGASVPAPRQLHAAVVVGARLLVLFGYRSPANVGDCWAFDFETCTWAQLLQPQCDTVPAPLRGAAAVVLGGEVYLHGGRTKEGPSDEAWALDSVAPAWRKLPTVEGRPSARYFHAAVLCHGCVCVFGGLGACGNLGDLTVFCSEPLPLLAADLFAQLPDDVFFNILQHLTAAEVVRVSRVSRRLHAAATQECVWKYLFTQCVGILGNELATRLESEAMMVSPQARGEVWMRGYCNGSLSAYTYYSPVAREQYEHVDHLLAALPNGECKLVMLGDGGVGKSTLTIKFTTNHCAPTMLISTFHGGTVFVSCTASVKFGQSPTLLTELEQL